MKLTKKEKNTIIALLFSEKEMSGFLRGFGKESIKEKKQKKFLENLINKIKELTI